MIKRTAAVLSLASFALISPVNAEDDFYLSIGAGIAYPNDAESDYTVGGTTFDIT